MGASNPRQYACDYCGYQGWYDASRPVDEVQCPRCGEPVTPME